MRFHLPGRLPVRVVALALTLGAGALAAASLAPQPPPAPLAPPAPMAPLAQKAEQASPKVVKLKFANDRVRVLETVSNPGDREAMHSHPANIVYVITGGKLRITTSDGKSTEVEFKTGDTLWREPVTHSAENIGATQLHAIIVELER